MILPIIIEKIANKAPSGAFYFRTIEFNYEQKIKVHLLVNETAGMVMQRKLTSHCNKC